MSNWIRRVTVHAAVATVMTAVLAASAVSQVPHPREVFGFDPGDDYQLADYDQMLEYYDRLDAASERVQKIEIGRTPQGRPLLLLFISSEENLRQLERWRETAESLARARIDEDEARERARNGKSIIWIDGGMHATERAHAQMTPLLAYRVATEETREMQRIRDDVILLLMPVMNPDGLEVSTSWYRENRGTPFETTGPPILYHQYVGHDNNRDWFMILQPETQAVSRVLYHEWYPQIVYNHHQTGPPWARMFIPPFADPVNPHIPPGVITGVNLVGAAMHQRFSEESKPGVISRVLFSMWWNGGGRTAPYYHNMIGILSETSHATPTPRYYDPAQLPDPLNPYGGRREASVSTSRPSMWYPNPWKGGWSHFRDAVDYMITGSLAVLDVGSRRREAWLYNIYDMGRDAIQAGGSGAPFAYVIPPEQWDPAEAVNMVNALRRGGVEVHRAGSSFRAGGEAYPAGSYVMYTAQAFRPYLMDLMEPQAYPDRRRFAGGPPDPPYDLAGWTLPIQMGVTVERIDEPFDAQVAAVTEARLAEGHILGDGGYGFALSRRANASTEAVNRLLADGDDLYRAAAAFNVAGQEFEAGTIVIESGGDTRSRVGRLAQALGVSFTALAARPDVELNRFHTPRIGLYKSWVPNMDEGWTRWLLEAYAFPLDTLHDADLTRVDLSTFDAIILPDQEVEELMNGHASGTMPDRYTGGIGLAGTAALRAYVEDGGTLIALDHAGDFAIRQLGLPVRNVLAELGEDEFFIPGSLIAMDVDTGHPLAAGMQEEAAAFFVRSSAFEPVALTGMGEGGREEVAAAPRPDVDVFARYAEEDLLLSGWALGEDRYLAGRGAAARVGLGEGDVVLIGFRSQFRGQPRGTFKLLFNALHEAALDRAMVPVSEQPPG